LSDEALACFIDDAIAYLESLDTSIEDECGTAVANRVAKYLAAHLASSSGDRQQIETQTLEAQDKYSDNVFGVGFDATTWGQTAKRFDCTNQLGNEDALAEKVVPTLRFTAVNVTCGKPSTDTYTDGDECDDC